MDIKNVLEVVAPTLASMLAGPDAGLAVSALEKVVGVAPGSGIDAVTTAMNNGLTGDQIVALKNAELEHQDKQATNDAAEVVEVNKTMQAEDAVGKPSGWRELCGYSLGITSFITSMGVLWLAYLAITGKDPSALNAIPTITSSLVMVLAIPGGAVGITAYHAGLADRGK